MAGGTQRPCGITRHMRGQRRTGRGTGKACGAVVARPELERAVNDLAARQHAVVTRAQLIKLGLRPGAIDRRIRSGRLRALQRGVYLLGPTTPVHAPFMAAVLSCGERAVVSHRSAASLWQLLSRPADSDIDVTVPGRDPGSRPGVCVHRVRLLGPDEVRTCQRIPITTPERTLLDIAAEVSARGLEQAVAEATRRRLANHRRLLTLIARYPTRHGVPALRELLHGDRRPALTRSAAEQRFLSLVRSAELPSPARPQPGRDSRGARVPRHPGDVATARRLTDRGAGPRSAGAGARTPLTPLLPCPPCPRKRRSRWRARSPRPCRTRCSRSSSTTTTRCSATSRARCAATTSASSPAIG